MGRAAKTYIYSVVAAGGLVLAVSLAHWSSPAPAPLTIYLVLALLASIVKLRLPGMDGTYSLNFLVLLYGVTHFSLAEVLIAGCAGAVAQSLLNTRKRSSPIRVLFNTANLTISTGICFLIARVWLAGGMAQYGPAVLAVAACAFFVVNTALVSGVLSLLQGKPLGEVCSQWYVWSFPYYLIGVALVGLLPSPGPALPGEAWLILLPLLYLLHFFVGLRRGQDSSPAIGETTNSSLARGARLYVLGVAAAGAVLLIAAVLFWESQNARRFVSYLTLAVVASTLKIRLPHMRGTMSPSFVLMLVAIAELSLAETVVLAAVAGVVQSLWRPARRPMLAQVLFNPASLALSAAFAYGASRVWFQPWGGQSPAAVLVVATLVLYGSNIVMMAVVLALADRKPLSAVWQHCYFWSCPYHLVGTAVAAVMTWTCRAADWPTSLLALPLMALVYVSYRGHVLQAVARQEQSRA
jgi:hypothetical protein